MFKVGAEEGGREGELVAYIREVGAIFNTVSLKIRPSREGVFKANYS